MPRHRSIALSSFVLVLVLLLSVWISISEAQTALDPDRVKQIAALLPVAAQGVGQPITDRKTWDAVAQLPGFLAIVGEAERLVEQRILELTDELFLEFSRTGNRTRCQKIIKARHRRLSVLVLAECIENQRRFLPAIEETIREICAEKTWVLPAHDHGLTNFYKTKITVDLVSSAISWHLATTDYWLGDKISEEVRKLIRREVKWRTFEPYESYLATGEPKLWWATTNSNWNAVCLAGVTGAALALVESPVDRAKYVAAAEYSLDYFFRGFTSDGYCSEGLGYWNYGFGNFVLLAETVRHATGGKIDLCDRDKVEQIAQFGHRMEIAAGVYPAFADCRVGSKPDAALMVSLDRRFDFGWGLASKGAAALTRVRKNLPEVGLYVHETLRNSKEASELPAGNKPLREWFPDAGVLICRPAADKPNGFGIALKGGHNAEHHNHNDVGSYMIALAGKTPLVDPGLEVYTARTFSSKRYDSDVLNSLGHPVPRVAGQLQQSGRAAAAQVLATDFNAQHDSITLDLKAAYEVDALEKLERSFVFSRDGSGSLTVSDTVRYASPQEFGTALITFLPWKKLTPNRLLIGKDDAQVVVEISTDGPSFKIHAEEIHEDLPEDLPEDRIPVRIGIDFDEPVRKATITVQITPAD